MCERLLGAIAMVNIPVEHQDLLESNLGRVDSRGGQRIEEAVPVAPVPVSVMTGQPADVRAFELSGAHQVDRLHHRTEGVLITRQGVLKPGALDTQARWIRERLSVGHSADLLQVLL